MKTKEKKFVMTATALSSLKNILSTPVVCLEFFLFFITNVYFCNIPSNNQEGWKEGLSSLKNDFSTLILCLVIIICCFTDLCFHNILVK